MSPQRGSPGCILRALRGVVALPVQGLFCYLDWKKSRADSRLRAGAEMAVKASTVKEGDRLWEVRRQRMGNTTMSRQVVRPVDVVRIKTRESLMSPGMTYTVWVVRVNHGAEQEYSEGAISDLRRSIPKGAEQ